MGNGLLVVDKGRLAADFEADVADGLSRNNKPLFCHCEAVGKRVNTFAFCLLLFAFFSMRLPRGA